MLRVQRLEEQPRSGHAARRRCPSRARPSASTGSTAAGPTVETLYLRDLHDAEYAIEVCYEGSYDFDEATLKDGSILDDHFSAMGGWISSVLVRVGDLTFDFLPPLDLEER